MKSEKITHKERRVGSPYIDRHGRSRTTSSAIKDEPGSSKPPRNIRNTVCVVGVYDPTAGKPGPNQQKIKIRGFIDALKEDGITEMMLFAVYEQYKLASSAKATEDGISNIHRLDVNKETRIVGHIRDYDSNELFYAVDYAWSALVWNAQWRLEAGHLPVYPKVYDLDHRVPSVLEYTQLRHHDDLRASDFALVYRYWFEVHEKRSQKTHSLCKEGRDILRADFNQVYDGQVSSSFTTASAEQIQITPDLRSLSSTAPEDVWTQPQYKWDGEVGLWRQPNIQVIPTLAILVHWSSERGSTIQASTTTIINALKLFYGHSELSFNPSKAGSPHKESNCPTDTHLGRSEAHWSGSAKGYQGESKDYATEGWLKASTDSVNDLTSSWLSVHIATAMMVQCNSHTQRPGRSQYFHETMAFSAAKFIALHVSEQFLAPVFHNFLRSPLSAKDLTVQGYTRELARGGMHLEVYVFQSDGTSFRFTDGAPTKNWTGNPEDTHCPACSEPMELGSKVSRRIKFKDGDRGVTEYRPDKKFRFLCIEERRVPPPVSGPPMDSPPAEYVR
ncbi:hypothetical protein CALVIDRAFT_531168 [Calocera viscosa TUFC12733]|uniref:Uncharacterized protein n=1 Tax=Calocera viscosa (strain TUFC12733) TaxID=1330018 RepID=A0A167GTS8_CALVF|nr:hypothetical protein CALVIDRAFT_531168 [Calocera viscosa TUFC12733]